MSIYHPLGPHREGSAMFVVWLLAALLAIVPAASSAARAQSPGILGVWTTDKNKSRIEIVNCSPPKQGLCGTIIWLSEPNDAQGKPQTDKRNKNPKLRGNPIVGLRIFEGWRPAGSNAWKGEIYDPEEGETYEIDISLAGDKLTLKGCVLFVCDSEKWTRYRG